MPVHPQTPTPPKWWATTLVVLLVSPWFWIVGRFIPVFVDVPFVTLSNQHQQDAWTLGLVLLSVGVVRVALKLLGRFSKMTRWVCAVVLAMGGLLGWFGVWVVLGLGAVFDAASEPRVVTEPAHCMAGGGAHMIDGVVAEWTACAGADESFLQGRLLYLVGEGVADVAMCQAFRTATHRAKDESVWCDAAKPELWTRVDCPPFAGASASMCFQCSTRTPSVDDHNVLVGWTADCSGVHVVRSINVDLDQVPRRVAEVTGVL